MASEIDAFPGLSSVESLILKLACDQVVSSGTRQIATVQFLPKISELGVEMPEVVESLQTLHARQYINGLKVGVDIRSIIVLVDGFDLYAKAYLPNYDRTVQLVVYHITSNGAQDNESLQQLLNQPTFIIDYVLDLLAGKGLVEMHRLIGGRHVITKFSPELKRMLH